jgi:hypothetical protein
MEQEMRTSSALSMIKALTNTADDDGRQLDLFGAPPLIAPRSAAYSGQVEADRVRLAPYLGAYALSIRAPWVSWIFGTGPDRKTWENRVWRPSFRPSYRGPLLIHLSQWWDLDSVCDTIAEVGDEWRSRHDHPMYAAIPDALSTPRHLHALRGHLLGWVDLTDIRHGRDLAGEFWVDEGGASPEHHCCLRLENPRLLAEPVRCQGKLGLFRVQQWAGK